MVEDLRQKVEGLALRELITSIASWAGKGKDEVIQIIGREIGQAVAAMLREPLARAIEGQKLRVTFEILAKSAQDLKASPRPRQRGPRRPKGKERRAQT